MLNKTPQPTYKYHSYVMNFPSLSLRKADDGLISFVISNEILYLCLEWIQKHLSKKYIFDQKKNRGFIVNEPLKKIGSEPL